MLADPIAVLLEVVGILDDLGIPYLVGGSVASSVFGVYRSTDDADLAIDLPTERVPALVSRLRPAFYVDENRRRDAVDRKGYRLK